ncbi:22K [Duck adenovirus 4]|uniref:22K n=1 Tax=Duck adenovirus 4 TaxID=2726020 RepID=A0A6M3Q9T4_9ADEN|nr:22K [Duck adenovirus 4]
MAQRMVDEKTRAAEPPEAESRTPMSEEEDIDGESLGSQDTDFLSEEEEEDQQEQEQEEQETAHQQQKRERSSQTPPSRTATPAVKRRVTSSIEEVIVPKVAAKRGKYRSWARYRVAICQALRDTVFDRRQAAELLKRSRRLYVPPSVVAYYARKLCS